MQDRWAKVSMQWLPGDERHRRVRPRNRWRDYHEGSFEAARKKYMLSVHILGVTERVLLSSKDEDYSYSIV